MTANGDTVMVFKGIDGQYYAKSSGSISTGDLVQVSKGIDGQYYASKSGNPSVGSDVIVSMGSNGKWLAHISDVVVICSEVQPTTVQPTTYRYFGWLGYSGGLMVAWYVQGGHCYDPYDSPDTHDEFVYEKRDINTFEPYGDCIHVPYTYSVQNDILWGLGYVPSILYRSPGWFSFDAYYLYDAWGKRRDYYPFTNLYPTDNAAGWGMSDYFGLYNPYGGSKNYFLYDKSYNQQYTVELKREYPIQGMGCGDLDDFYTFDDSSHKVNRYSQREGDDPTISVATSVSEYTFQVGSVWGGMLLLEDSILMGLEFSTYGGLPTSGVRLDRNTLEVMDLIQDG